MKTLDVTEILKERFRGRKIQHSSGAEMYDGQTRTWTDASGTWTSVYEIGYGDLDFIDLVIDYGQIQQANLPKEYAKRRWILENFTDVPDKKNLSLSLNYSESITAGTSTSITQGKTATFRADANFNISVVGKASIGYSETITLSTQNNVSKSVSSSNGKTEVYDLSYEVPPKKAAIIDLIKELVPYEMPFTANMVVDGYFYIIATYLHNGAVTKQPIDKGWGKISDYINQEERTLVVDGKIGQIVGEVTRRSIRHEDLKDDVDPSKFNQLMMIGQSNSSFPPTGFANIKLSNITSFEGGYFEVIFDVETPGCFNSSCAGFDATLILESDEVEVTEIYSFEGWAIADTGTSFFSISRSGNRIGNLKDVTNIQSPEIICDDE